MTRINSIAAARRAAGRKQALENYKAEGAACAKLANTPTPRSGVATTTPAKQETKPMIYKLLWGDWEVHVCGSSSTVKHNLVERA